jgi:hypothetical protein
MAPTVFFFIRYSCFPNELFHAFDGPGLTGQ